MRNKSKNLIYAQTICVFTSKLMRNQFLENRRIFCTNKMISFKFYKLNFHSVELIRDERVAGKTQ